MSVNVEILERVPALQSLTPVTLRHVAPEASVVCHKAGDILYGQGDAAPGLYFLLSGRVKLYRQSKERMQIFAILTPGECFGVESLPDDTPTPYAATALTAARALFIPQDRLHCLLNNHSDFQVVLLELVSERLQQFVSVVHNLAFRDVSARLAAVLIGLAETEGEMNGDGVRIQRLLTGQDLASMVGSAREVIHRTLKKFEQDQLVRVTSTHFYILDPDKLAALAQEEIH